MAPKEENKILPFYQDTDHGFKICGQFSLDAFKSAIAYKPRPDDFFIVTYPKCGTTWVQNIVGCIFREGKPFTSALEFLSSTPFLEMAGADAAKTMKRPGAIKLHLPFHLTPWSPQAKYIFVARNPKDCVVSFYHHTKNIPGYKFKNGSFDDYFELFMDGKVDFGDYFDTLISWYEHRNDPNVLFITYEQLKRDAKTYVLKIAEFMGEKYKEMLTKDENLLNDVIKYSSFDFMKESMNRQVSELAALPKDYIQNHPDVPQGLKDLLASGDGFFDSDPNAITFVRKGIVGDFKNHLSPVQNQRLEEKFKQRTKGTDIPELWKDIMNVDSTQSSNPIIPSPKHSYQVVDGFQIPSLFSVDCFRSALNYKPRPDDLFLATYPKCGTTWAQYMLIHIFRQGEPLSSMTKFYAVAPFLEMTGAQGAETMPRPGAIKVHLPYHLTPRSDTAKYIYVTRNPKDCCVSYYNHMKNMPGHGFNGTFDDFFELFISGDIDYGDYFDHLLSWYAHRNDPNVLFVTYEQMKENPEEIVLKMASFIDDKLYAEPLRNDSEKLKNVIKYSSFKHMKEVVNKGMDDIFTMSKEELLKSEIPDEMKKLFSNIPAPPPDAEAPKKTEFVRKGIVGDWRNYFSEEQSKRMDEKFLERTKDTDIPNLFKKYMNVDSTQPSNPFMTSPKPFTQFVDGFQIPGMFSVDCFRSALNYKPRPDDLFLATYPKCGTTWTQHMLLLIFRQGEPLSSAIKFHAAAPFLEMTGAQAAETMPRPGALKVHLPYHLTPRSDTAKYIYVTRNPKDCCVSYYHHMKNIPGHGFNGTFDDFFEYFISGNIDYGDYFDHLLGWYAHRNDPNVLFVTYEQMKENPEEIVLKMASFIDDKLYAEPLRNDSEKLKNVIKYSSFKHMKEVVNKGMDDLFTMSKEELLKSEMPDEMKKLFSNIPAPPPGAEAPKKSEFVRKGIVGDWRNYFSEEQSKRMDEKFLERTKDTDIPNLFKKYM